MTTDLYRVNPGDLPMASDLDQFVDALNGTFDIGDITLAQSISAPDASSATATAVVGSGLDIGAYQYKVTYIVGYVKSNGNIVYGGETDGSTEVDVTTSSGNQKVVLNGLPTTWPTTAVGLRIYRTTVGGSTFKLVATVTTPSATYNDTTADASLTTDIPSTNGTGTSLTLNAFAKFGTRSYVQEVDGDLWVTSNAYYDGIHWQRVDTSKFAFAHQLQGTNNIPFEGVQGVNVWRAVPSANPIGDFGAYGGWEMMYTSTGYRDFAIGGSNLELDGNGAAPYSRVSHVSGEGTYLTINAFYDGSSFQRDDEAKGAAALRVNEDGTFEALTCAAGANPIVWTADDLVTKGYADATFLPKFTNISGQDLNNITTDGEYGGNNLTNAPGGSTQYFLVKLIKYSTNNYAQFATNIQTGVHYFRVSYGAWGSWRTVWTDSNLANPAKTDAANVFTNTQTISVGALGTSAGSTFDLLKIGGTDGNVDSLVFRLRRSSAGSTWNTATQEFFRYVDTTQQQTIRFNPNGDIELVPYAGGSSGALSLPSGNFLYRGTALPGLRDTSGTLEMYTSGAWKAVTNKKVSRIQLSASSLTSSATTANGNAALCGLPFTYKASEWTTNSFIFESSFYGTNNAGTYYVGLWDITAGAAVAGSEVSATGTTGGFVQSGTLTLTDGHQYGYYVKSSSSSYSITMYACGLLHTS